MPAEPTPHRPNPETAYLLERLMTERGARLVRLAASITDRAQAEDAVQAACVGFLRAFDPATAYDDLDGAYRYLARAVANAASRINRTDRRRHDGLPPAPIFDDEPHPLELAQSERAEPLESVLRHEEFVESLERLAELPADQQAVLVERAMGYAPAEVETRLGLSSRQYRKRVEKARRRLG